MLAGCGARPLERQRQSRCLLPGWIGHLFHRQGSACRRPQPIRATAANDPHGMGRLGCPANVANSLLVSGFTAEEQRAAVSEAISNDFTATVWPSAAWIKVGEGIPVLGRYSRCTC